MSYTVYKQKYPELLCPHCRKRTSYQIHDHMKEEDIKGIQFQWKETYGICDECGKEIFLPEIYDQNMENLDKDFWKHYNEEKKRDLEILINLVILENIMKKLIKACILIY